MADKVPGPVRVLIGVTRAILAEVGKVVRDPVVFNALRAELDLPPRVLNRDAIDEVNAKLVETDGRLAAAELSPDADLSLDESIFDALALGSKLAEIIAALFADTTPPEKAAELVNGVLGLIMSERLRLRAPFFWACLRLLMLGYEKAEDVPRFNPVAIFDRLTGAAPRVPDGGFTSTDAMAGLVVPPVLIGLNVLMDMVGLSPVDIARLRVGAWYLDGSVTFKMGWEPDPETPEALQRLLSRALTVRIGGTMKVKGELTEIPVALLVTILPVEPEDGGPGFLIRLKGDVEILYDLAPGDPIQRKLKVRVAGVGVAGMDILWNTRAGTFDRLPGGDAGSDVSVEWSTTGTEAGPAFRLGKKDCSRFDIVGYAFKGEASAENVGIALAVKGAKLVLLADDLMPGLEVILDALGAKKFEAKIDGALKLSSGKGLSFEGSAGLKTRLFSNANIGIGRMDYVDLVVGVKNGKPVLGAEAAARFKIGPFAASIDRFGFLSPADGTALIFQPPRGIGITLDFCAVKGGGFLLLDFEAKRFAGAFSLSIAGFSVNAIAILSAGGPGTDTDFALFILVHARFPGGLELGLRFTLNAIGGLIGINHGFDLAALEKALPSGAMDDVLFPADPVGDAPRIIASLTTIFPVRKGAWTFGFMMEIGWGSDYFCSLRLGLIVPVGTKGDAGDQFSYIYLLGRMSVTCFEHIPKPLRLQLICDVIGEIGLWVSLKPFKMRFSLRFYARLRDSRFGPTTIEGAIVFSMRTGPDARLLLAAGGFHPGFKQIPEDIPSPIDRIGTSYDIGVIKTWVRAYFAVAAGTLQFGFSIGCQYQLGPIAFKGELAADALIHLDPFSFEVGCSAHVALTYRGHELLGVHLKVTLWGPDRWRIKGRGEISILFWDVPVEFDESWGDDVTVPPVGIDAKALVRKDLENPSHWRFELPGSETSVSFGTVIPPADPAVSLAHPLAALSYAQRRLPFGLALDRISFGQIIGPRGFGVPQITTADGTALPGAVTLTDQFTTPEFLHLSDQDRLTKPSFETLPSGVATGAGGFVVPETAVIDAALDYELILRSTGNTGLRHRGLMELVAVDALDWLIAGEATARASVRPIRSLQDGLQGVRIQAPVWKAVVAETLAVGGVGPIVDVVGLDAPWAAASPSAMQAATGPGVVLVEAFEVAGA